MPIKLEIPDNYLPQAKELYTTIAREVYSKMLAAQKEWADLQPILKELGIDTPESKLAPQIKPLPVNLNGFNKGWSWAQKAKYILNKAGKPLTASTISEILISEYQPELSIKQVRNSLPATLSADAKKGKFRAFTLDGEWVYEPINE